MQIENYYDEEPDMVEEKKKEWHDNQYSPLSILMIKLLLAISLLVAGVVYVPRWVANNHPELYDILGGNDTENYGVRGENKQSIENNPNQNSNGKQATSKIRQ